MNDPLEILLSLNLKQVKPPPPVELSPATENRMCKKFKAGFYFMRFFDSKVNRTREILAKDCFLFHNDTRRDELHVIYIRFRREKPVLHYGILQYSVMISYREIHLRNEAAYFEAMMDYEAIAQLKKRLTSSQSKSTKKLSPVKAASVKDKTPPSMKTQNNNMSTQTESPIPKSLSKSISKKEAVAALTNAIANSKEVDYKEELAKCKVRLEEYKLNCKKTSPKSPSPVVKTNAATTPATTTAVTTIYDKFLKMRKMGVPDPAIQNKMLMEGHSMDEVNFVLGKGTLDMGKVQDQKNAVALNIGVTLPKERPAAKSQVNHPTFVLIDSLIHAANPSQNTTILLAVKTYLTSYTADEGIPDNVTDMINEIYDIYNKGEDRTAKDLQRVNTLMKSVKDFTAEIKSKLKRTFDEYEQAFQDDITNTESRYKTYRVKEDVDSFLREMADELTKMKDKNRKKLNEVEHILLCGLILMNKKVIADMKVKRRVPKSTPRNAAPRTHVPTDYDIQNSELIQKLEGNPAYLPEELIVNKCHNTLITHYQNVPISSNKYVLIDKTENKYEKIVGSAPNLDVMKTEYELRNMKFEYPDKNKDNTTYYMFQPKNLKLQNCTSNKSDNNDDSRLFIDILSEGNRNFVNYKQLFIERPYYRDNKMKNDGQGNMRIYEKNGNSMQTISPDTNIYKGLMKDLDQRKYNEEAKDHPFFKEKDQYLTNLMQRKVDAKGEDIRVGIKGGSYSRRHSRRCRHKTNAAPI